MSGASTERIFFYGLYMDAALLEDLGLQIQEVGRACVNDFALRIGARASMVRETGSSAYGMLFDLPANDAAALYGRPEVAGYRPIDVTAELLDDDAAHLARCYVLPGNLLDNAANPDYANRLAALLATLELPAAYVAAMAALGGG